MAWFDRGAGGKKTTQEEKTEVVPESKPAPMPTPTAAPAPQPTQPASPPPEPAPVVQKAPPPPAPAEPGLVAALHKGSRVTGQLVFQGPARIDGSVDGEIQCHGKLTIGEGAEVRAKISGESVIVRGRVEGNITAREKVELVAPARLFGNVNTPRLTIAEGVVFDGDCSMGMAKAKNGITGSKIVSADKAGPAAKQAEPDS